MASGWRCLGSHSFTYPDRQLVFILFSCQCSQADSAQCESEHCWAEPALLDDFAMPAANVALIRLLQDGLACGAVTSAQR